MASSPSGVLCLLQRLNSHLHTLNQSDYLVNLDPAVRTVPYSPNIDIRDTVNYKEVMTQLVSGASGRHGLRGLMSFAVVLSRYSLGPNGGILTSLNLFTTKFDQVLDLMAKRAPELSWDPFGCSCGKRADQRIVLLSFRHILIDTPGQIEIFTWSASGAIITETLAATYPTVVAYIIDTPRSVSPATFMSNMLYACSILYKTRLPFVLVFNKTDVVPHEFAIEWMKDYESFQAALQEDTTYMSSLVNSMCLVLEEFYNTLRVCGTSAVTGAGMDDFLDRVKEAREEYYRCLSARVLSFSVV